MAEPDDVLLMRSLRIMQTITGAMVFGVVAFLAIAVLTTGQPAQGQQANEGLPFLTLVAVAMLAFALPMSVLLPAILTRAALRQIASEGGPSSATGDRPGVLAGRLVGVHATAHIVSLAILEGSAFLGVVAYMIDRHLVDLAVTGIAVLMMLLRLPTAGRVRSWLARQTDALAALRREQFLAGGR